jgi:ornithine cyclodeaminase/alanine dehydrogenase-like protein (mu-crystallin family)
MLILNAKNVRAALPMVEAIESMRRAFAALTEGRVLTPSRTHIDIEQHDGATLVMPALLYDGDSSALAVKVVSLFDGNHEKGLARIQASVLMFELHTGCPIALLDGAALTAIRTGAASGLATEFMARPESKSVAIFGAGVQARTQLEAVRTVRNIEEVAIYSPVPGEADVMVAELLAETSTGPFTARAASSPADALSDADIVCTATASSTPVFEDDMLRPGTHINAIGSYKPHVAEIPPETVVRAHVVVDQHEAAMEEAGDLIQPIEAGLITWNHIAADLGELVLGRSSGRTSPDEITFFKSVGNAVQDAAAAATTIKNAKEQGLGFHYEEM